LHSGQSVKMVLSPAPAYTGIKFIRDGVEIPATVDYATGFAFATTLSKDGKTVSTIEHLLGALYLLGIDNLYIYIDGEEVPILDGSAIGFIQKIKEAGIKTFDSKKLYAVINKNVSVEDGDKYITASPSDTFKATYHASYNNSIIGDRKYTFTFEKENFEEIAKARTYCFLEEVEYLKSMGLAKGGSLENAVVFEGDKVLNPEGLRFEDEPVKHKLLDLIGDIYLLGYPIVGEIYSYKGGHKLNAQLVKKLKEEEAFTLEEGYHPALQVERLVA